MNFWRGVCLTHNNREGSDRSHSLLHAINIIDYRTIPKAITMTGILKIRLTKISNSDIYVIQNKSFAPF